MAGQQPLKLYIVVRIHYLEPIWIPLTAGDLVLTQAVEVRILNPEPSLLSPTAEASGSNPVQYRFESYSKYQIWRVWCNGLALLPVKEIDSVRV